MPRYAQIRYTAEGPEKLCPSCQRWYLLSHFTATRSARTYSYCITCRRTQARAAARARSSPTPPRSNRPRCAVTSLPLRKTSPLPPATDPYRPVILEDGRMACALVALALREGYSEGVLVKALEEMGHWCRVKRGSGVKGVPREERQGKGTRRAQEEMVNRARERMEEEGIESLVDVVKGVKGVKGKKGKERKG